MVENPPANAGDMGSSPGPGRSHIKKKKKKRLLLSPFSMWGNRDNGQNSRS